MGRIMRGGHQESMWLFQCPYHCQTFIFCFTDSPFYCTLAKSSTSHFSSLLYFCLHCLDFLLQYLCSIISRIWFSFYRLRLSQLLSLLHLFLFHLFLSCLLSLPSVNFFLALQGLPGLDRFFFLFLHSYLHTWMLSIFSQLDNVKFMFSAPQYPSPVDCSYILLWKARRDVFWHKLKKI